MALRTGFLLLAPLCLLALLVSCNPGKSSERRLLIYTPHGEDLLRDFISRYKQQHPEVDIQFLDMGSRDVFERVRAERNRPQADLWWGAAHTTFQTAAEENLLAAYKPSWSGKISPASHDASDRWYGVYETPEVIVYNSDAVHSQDAPRDWDDLLDTKWRDKVLIRNPNPSDTMRAIFGEIMWRSYKNTNGPEHGYNWLRKLDANVHEYTADGTLLMQKLARQEGLVTMWDLPDVWVFKQQKNFPVNYSMPTSGTPVVTDGIAILQGAPNAEEAKRFYEFVTTPENLIYAAQKYYRIPVRTDIDRSQLPGWMNEPFQRSDLDWMLLRQKGNEWMNYWDTQIRGRNK